MIRERQHYPQTKKKLLLDKTQNDGSHSWSNILADRRERSHNKCGESHIFFLSFFSSVISLKPSQAFSLRLILIIPLMNVSLIKKQSASPPVSWILRVIITIKPRVSYKVSDKQLSAHSFSLLLFSAPGPLSLILRRSLWAIKRPGASGELRGLQRLDLDKLVSIHKPGILTKTTTTRFPRHLSPFFLSISSLYKEMIKTMLIR